MPKEFPRKLRLNSQIQRELDDLIRSHLTDPRVARVTITSVDVTPDLRHAKILISVLALEAKPEEAAEALNHAAGHLRHELGRRLHIRRIPQLHFVPDRAIIEGDRISGLIRKAVKADRESAGAREGAATAPATPPRKDEK